MQTNTSNESSTEIVIEEVSNADSQVTQLSDRIDGLRDLLPEPLMAVWGFVVSHPYIGSILVAVFGFIFAKALVLFFRKVASQLTKRTKSQVDDKLLDLLAKSIFITIFMFFLMLALRPVLGNGQLYNILGNIIASIVIMNWLSSIIPGMRMSLELLGRNHHKFPLIEERTIPLFNILSMVLLIGIGTYALLLLWGINPAAWLASAGVLGIAIGFAAKDTLANLFSGVFIVADSPYSIGDFINLDSGERGQVTSVGLRSTRLITRDDVEITIPNAIIANAKIINESGGPYEKSRIRIKVGVAYGSDLNQVVSVLEEIAENYPNTASMPTPRVRMRGFGDSSVDFELLCWIDKPVQRGLVSHELYMAVYQRFIQDGIEIPFPQHQIHITKAD